MRQMAARTGALVVAAASWAAAISGTKFALGGFGAVTLLGVELVAAALVLWVFVLIRGVRLPAPWRYAIALGLLEPCVAYLGDTLGLQRTSAANASVIGGTEALFVVILAAVFLRERITVSSCLAVSVGLFGLVVLERADGLTGPGMGDLLILGGALSAAGYTIVARRVEDTSRDEPAVDCLTLTAQQFLVAAIAVAPCTIAAWAGGSEAVPRDVPARCWLAAVAVGVVGFAASFLLYNWAIARVEARTSAVILNLIPVFGLVCAGAWLGERLSGSQLSGAGLIAASVAVFGWIELRSSDEPPGRTVLAEEISWQRVSR